MLHRDLVRIKTRYESINLLIIVMRLQVMIKPLEHSESTMLYKITLIQVVVTIVYTCHTTLMTEQEITS